MLSKRPCSRLARGSRGPRARTKPIAPEDVLSNKYVAPANQFDVDRVATDAQTYVLPPEFQEVDVDAIKARL